MLWYREVYSPALPRGSTMPPTIRELGIDRLSVQDRLALVQEIWDSIAAEADQLPLTEETKGLLDRRIADLEARPGEVLTWDQIRRSVQGER
jgi:putative addiction module component (TIGR02574 family)